MNIELPRAAKLTVEALMRIHGSATLTKERTGLHAYFACPSCLEKEGKRELRRRHLAVNLSKHCALDHYASRQGSYDAQLTALCMKEGKPFRVNVLLGMKPLAP